MSNTTTPSPALTAFAVLPHGAMILDSHQRTRPEHCVELREQMLEVAFQIRQMQPDVIVFSTPHGINLGDSLGIYSNSTASGHAGWKGHWDNFTANIEIDTATSEQLFQHLKQRDVDANQIKMASNLLPLPLNWGDVVPLYYLQHVPQVKFIIIAPPLLAHLEVSKRFDVWKKMGEAITEFIDTKMSNKKVVYVVSGDLSHAHPYKPPSHLPDEERELYMPAQKIVKASPEHAKEYDSIVCGWLNGSRDLVIPPDLPPKALSCAFPGLFILKSVIGSNFSSQVLAYHVPTYYGMVVAMGTRKQ